MSRRLDTLVEDGIIDIPTAERILNFGFEANRYSEINSKAIMNAIFGDALEANPEKEIIVNFLANNIYISNSNIIILRNFYNLNENIGYIYSSEIIDQGGTVRRFHIIHGFGLLTNNGSDALNIKDTGTSPLIWRFIIDSKTGEVSKTRLPSGTDTELGFSRFFSTEDAIIYAIINGLGTDLLKTIISSDISVNKQNSDPAPFRGQITGVEFIGVQIGDPTVSHGESIRPGYIEVRFVVRGLDSISRLDNLIGHGIPAHLRDLVFEFMSGVNILEAVNGKVFYDPTNHNVFSQEYIYRIPLVFLNQILQNVAQYNPELLAQALGRDINTGFQLSLELLLLISTFGGIAAVGMGEAKRFISEYLEKVKNKEGEELPEGHVKAIEYLNLIVGLRYSPKGTSGSNQGYGKLAPENGGLNINQVNLHIKDYSDTNDAIDLQTAKSLISIYRLIETDPNILARINGIRQSDKTTERMMQYLLAKKQLNESSVNGTFSLDNLDFQSIQEIVAAIPKRFDGGLAELRELREQLKTLNESSDTYLTLKNLRDTIDSEVTRIKAEQSQKPINEKSIEVMIINGQLLTTETLSTQDGKRKDKSFYFAGHKVSGATNIELPIILKNLLENYDGSPNNLDILDHDKRMFWIEPNDSPICAFIYSNANDNFIIMYDSATREFLIEKITEGKTVQDQKSEMTKAILNPNSLATELSEQADIPSLIPNAILGKLTNGLLEIDEAIMNVYRTDSRSKKAVIQILAEEISKPDQRIVKISSVTDPNVLSTFSRVIAARIADIMLGAGGKQMTQTALDAATADIKNFIQQENDVVEVHSFKDKIDKNSRIHIVRIKYRNGVVKYVPFVEPHNHNSAR